MNNQGQNLTIKDKIIEHFSKEILNGSIGAGERLPGEREIADQMNVSRSIVHLAMEQMSNLGLVDMIPRKGNYASDYRKSGTIETMQLMAKYGDAAMAQDMVFSLVELRNVIEGGSFIILANKGSKEDFKKLTMINDEFREAISKNMGNDMFAEINHKFHHTIVELSGNWLYLAIMNSFSDIKSPWVKCVEHWTPEGTVEQNDKIIELLESGQGREASKFIADVFEQYKAETDSTGTK